MASSNRHWPSLFKSKPCNAHHQWQHDLNASSIISGSSQKTPYSSGIIGSEERTPEPKPRWNPKPEQIRILEAIFNSGMVNPPRDEIRKIRVQLQEYGQVGDANVFYWFQNRKSRSKHKQRQLQSRQQQSRPVTQPTAAAAVATANVGALTAASSSSASSDPSNSSGCSDKTLQSSKSAASGSNVVDMSNSPTNSVNNQTFFHADQFSGEPFFFPTTPACQQAPPPYSLPSATTSAAAAAAADLSLSTFPGMITSAADPQALGLITRPCLWNELLCQDPCKPTSPSPTPTTAGGGKKQHLQHHNIYATSAATTTAVNLTFPSATASAPVPFSDTLQGGPCQCGEAEGGAAGGGPRQVVVVFINEVAFEVAAGALNVREAFGVDAVLLHSSGLPVLVDDWGVTLQPLQHGASYYVV